MNIAVTCFISWLAAVELPIGTELQYTGSLSRQMKSELTEVKSFSVVTTRVVHDDNGSEQFAYSLEERGGGGWGWPERFGLLPSQDRPTLKSLPMRLLYLHEDQSYSLPLRSPLFESRDKLVLKAAWKDGHHEFLVTRKRKLKDRDCIQIEVSSNLGRIQTLVVDLDSGVLVSLDERVTIGRGDEFQLKMELQAQQTLSAEVLHKHRTTLDSLLAIQLELNRTGEQKVVELTSNQMAVLEKEMPRIEKESEGTSWTKLVASIRRDLSQQQKRLEGIAGLEKKLIGQPAPKFLLKQFDGTPILEAELKDHVVVLHFWQYRGEPLVEPYGQIGYLDFLNQKRKRLGVKVVGINIDERFTNLEQKGAAVRSMKKFIEFMNVGFDIAVDDGSIIAEFGDPRNLGAPLPLWVVIGHDGIVTYYHTGFFDIKPDEGLRQLDEAVVNALRRQKGK